MVYDREEYTMNYPEPPQALYSAPVDMNSLSPASFTSYTPRQSHGMTFDPSSQQLYADAPYMFSNGRQSPGMHMDESDMQVPSSSLSTASASSSTMGSPLSNSGQLAPMPEWTTAHGLAVSPQPGIVDQSDYFPGSEYSFAASQGLDAYNHFDYVNTGKPPGFVDPSLIHPDVRSMAMPQFEAAYPSNPAYTPHSPALSASSQLRNASTSPFLHSGTYQHPQQRYSPYPPPLDQQGRRPSIVSYQSPYSAEQPFSNSSSDEGKEKQRCPHPDCGKTFKDLKAHMLTHMEERPEKCPITTCDYHTKGFARKYDKNRHTLTHYKGTMVCGFCPGSGSSAEKSFNRADVFKRHLTAVHGVEQTPPNSRKKAANGGSGCNKKLTSYAPDATGKCSTCSVTFSNAQDFYEHLDDCVLRIVQQEDPAEAVNARRLAEVENDRDVHSTLEKNNLPTTTAAQSALSSAEGMEEEDAASSSDEDFKADALANGLKTSATSPTKKSHRSNPANGVQKSRGMTHSRGGVPPANMSGSGKGGRKGQRPDYPSSWGFDKSQMVMKKRVLTVFDGPRRLVKDDMMMSTEHEVRVPLHDGRAYVTDLDVQTMRRAEGFLGATDEEKGYWVSDDPTEEQMQQMLELDAGTPQQ